MANMEIRCPCVLLNETYNQSACLFTGNILVLGFSDLQIPWEYGLKDERFSKFVSRYGNSLLNNLRCRMTEWNNILHNHPAFWQLNNDSFSQCWYFIGKELSSVADVEDLLALCSKILNAASFFYKNGTQDERFWALNSIHCITTRFCRRNRYHDLVW